MPLLTFIVEDNPLVLESLCEALEETGACIAGSAGSASEAIEWLHCHSAEWRLLIVDLFLVRSSGLDVIEACRGRAQEQHAVVLSNYATPEVRQLGMALGADAVFDKSTEVEELMAYCTALGAA